MFVGGVGREEAADVEDHVAAAALEAVHEQRSARGAAPDGAGHGHLAYELERGRRGGARDRDVVDVDVALAAWAVCGGSRYGQRVRAGGQRANGAQRTETGAGSGTYL